MHRFENESVMSVEEARLVATQHLQEPESGVNSVSVADLANTLRTSTDRVERLLAEVRNNGALERARSREHRNVWMTGLAALAVAAVCFAAIFVGSHTEVSQPIKIDSRARHTMTTDGTLAPVPSPAPAPEAPAPKSG